MMKGQNIVCFANDWDADPTSKHQVMKILACSNRVLWVNSIGLRRPGATVHDASRILKKLRQFWQGPVAVHHNMHVLTPLVIPFHGMPLVSVINAWLVSLSILRQVRKLGMEKFQMWVILPTAAPMIRHLKPEKVVYYCVDDWSAFSFLDGKLIQEMEERLIAQSDLVIASADALYASKRRLNPHTYLVPHGVDSEHFARARCETTDIAPELKGLPRPIIGFWGSIHEWIDLELLQLVATRHPEWSVVLVGKVEVDCGALGLLPNVHLVGTRSYESLPGFARGFTVAMLPFRINRLTESVNPIKLREYLAAGLPVVSTALPEVRPYASVVRIAATADDFVREMEAAVQDVSDTSAQLRIKAVQKETWLARVEYMSTLVENVGRKNHAGHKSTGIES